MKTVAIVQARMGSVRFPGKTMRTICGTPMIGLLLKRLASAKLIDQIVLATSEASCNELLSAYVRKLGYTVFRGDENDVLDRYYQAAKEVYADSIVRITGDCPLIDPILVDAVIAKFLDSSVDYAANKLPPTFPDGLDCEVFSFQSLDLAWNETRTPYEREHVTPYLYESEKFSTTNLGQIWRVLLVQEARRML